MGGLLCALLGFCREIFCDLYVVICGGIPAIESGLLLFLASIDASGMIRSLYMLVVAWTAAICLGIADG